MQSKVDQDFLAQLKELKDRVDAIEKDIEDKPDACIDKLNHLAVELTKLQESSSQISEAAKKPAELLRTRVKALDEETHTVNDRLNREEAITAACGDNAAFRQKLLEYADKFPQARRSGSFRAVASDEPPLWDWIGQWNEAVQTIGRRNPTKFDRKTAADLASKLRKLLDDRPGHPDADAFKQRLPYLDAIVHRIDGEGNPIEAALKPVFTDPLVAGVWMLTDTAGQKYYLLEDPATKFGPLGALQPGRTYGFEYVAGFDLSKKQKSLRGNDIKAGRAVAPQRATAKALAAILEGTTDEQWELSFCRMIETVLNDHDTDPLLKHFLLRKIVAVGCQGSLCLQKGFGGYVELLKNSKVPATVNWVDPNNSEAAEQRPVAEAELGKLPSFADAQNSAAKAVAIAWQGHRHGIDLRRLAPQEYGRQLAVPHEIGLPGVGEACDCQGRRGRRPEIRKRPFLRRLADSIREKRSSMRSRGPPWRRVGPCMSPIRRPSDVGDNVCGDLTMDTQLYLRSAWQGSRSLR